MARFKLPNFKIDKTAPESGMKELVQKVKPLWDIENVLTEEIIAGYSSKMFKCFPKGQPDNAIIFRLQNLRDRFEEYNEGIEIEVIEHMSAIDHFPQIHAVFSNGYCYDYVVGKPVMNIRSKIGKLTEEVLKAIADELAFIHSVELPNVDYQSVDYFKKLKNLVRKFDFKNSPKLAPTREQLCTELDIVENFVKSLNAQIVLCHGDAHPGNFVWNDKTKKITFFDWEITGIGYEFQEVAQFLSTLKIFDKYPEFTATLPENTEELFLKLYYEARSKYRNLKEYTFEEYKLKVGKLKMCFLVALIVYPLTMPDIFEEIADGETFDSFYENLLNGYLQVKKTFLGTDRLG